MNKFLHSSWIVKWRCRRCSQLMPIKGIMNSKIYDYFCSFQGAFFIRLSSRLCFVLPYTHTHNQNVVTQVAIRVLQSFIYVTQCWRASDNKIRLVQPMEFDSWNCLMAEDLQKRTRVQQNMSSMCTMREPAGTKSSELLALVLLCQIFLSVPLHSYFIFLFVVVFAVLALAWSVWHIQIRYICNNNISIEWNVKWYSNRRELRA